MFKASAGALLLCAVISAQADDNPTGTAGLGLPFTNLQETLAINYVVPLDGIYPTRDGGGPGADGFTLGFIRSWGGSFSPNYSVAADGRTISIAQSSALFSLFGPDYGGDGRTVFGMPDLAGRIPVHRGTGSERLGNTPGTLETALTTARLPAHDHAIPGIAERTSTIGGGASISNVQPSLVINHAIRLFGEFPSRDGGVPTENTFIGQIGLFGGSFAPDGWAFAEGQLLSPGDYPALFSLIGTTYGGDGRTSFALPDLRGRTAIGADGNGLPRGTRIGELDSVLTERQMPEHGHSLIHDVLPTGDTGGEDPVSRVQPSLALNYLISTAGIFPSRDGGGFPETDFLGEIALFAGDFAPDGWQFAHGQLLQIRDFSALFSLLGTTYGGDGRTTFALPDLRGRAAMGADAMFQLGGVFGANEIILTEDNLAVHGHTAVPIPAGLPLLASALLAMGGFRIRKPASTRPSRPEVCVP